MSFRHDSSHRHENAGGWGGGDPQRRLILIFGLTFAFMFVEGAGGLISGSLALLADAGHMLSDASAILLSLGALWLSRRAVTGFRTFGFRRAEFLAAFVNAIGLVALSGWIVYEAIQRVGSPREILSGVMLWVALAGLAVNVAGLWLLHGHASENLNLKSAVWHIMGDLLGSLAAVAAAVTIRFTGWTPIDPLLSIGIAALIGAAGGKILYDSANLLLDRVPAEIDTEEVRGFLGRWPDVRHICDLHIWSVSSSETLLTAHLVVEPQVNRDGFLRTLLPELQARFGLAHMTVQLESEPQASCPAEW